MNSTCGREVVREFPSGIRVGARQQQDGALDGAPQRGHWTGGISQVQTKQPRHRERRKAPLSADLASPTSSIQSSGSPDTRRARCGQASTFHVLGCWRVPSPGNKRVALLVPSNDDSEGWFLKQPGPKLHNLATTTASLVDLLGVAFNLFGDGASLERLHRPTNFGKGEGPRT